MTSNLFGGTLNLTQLQLHTGVEQNSVIQCLTRKNMHVLLTYQLNS